MEFKTKKFNKIMSYSYWTALHIAADNDNIEAVRLLLSNDKTDPNITIILLLIMYDIFIQNI